MGLWCHCAVRSHLPERDEYVADRHGPARRTGAVWLRGVGNRTVVLLPVWRPVGVEITAVHHAIPIHLIRTGSRRTDVVEHADEVGECHCLAAAPRRIARAQHGLRRIEEVPGVQRITVTAEPWSRAQLVHIRAAVTVAVDCIN